MKIRATIVWLLLSIPSLCLHAQKKDGDFDPKTANLKYRIRKNSPDSVNNLNLLLGLGGLSGTYNIAYGTSAILHYSWDNSITLNAMASLALYEPHTQDISQGKPAVAIKNWNNYEIGAAITIDKYYHNNTAEFFMGEYNNKGYFISVPSKELYTSAIHAGYGHYTSFANSASVKYSGYNVNDPDKQVVALSSLNKFKDIAGFGSMMQVNYFYGGFELIAINEMNVRFEDKKYGNRSYSKKYKFAFDALLAQSTNYSEIIITDGSNPLILPGTYLVNDNTPKFKFGARITYEFYPMNKIGIYYHFDAGVMPGVPWGWFLTIFLGIPLNTTIGQ
jgi:hypothetical protein